MLSPKTHGPLSGLVVIDLTRVLAGPYCTLMLADLGARVIKVEMPVLGDDARHVGPMIEDGQGGTISGYFFSINRNKESIALNLKLEADKVIFDKLLASADILVENFTPGTMARLGYDWDTVHARHPSLILASISGFGQTGPYRELPAYDMVVQAMGGVLSLTGEEGGPPTRVGVSIGDICAGMFGTIGIQAAIIERIRTGLGKHVDISMLDSQVALLENALVRYQAEGVVPGPIGSRHPSITPFGVFKAKDTYMVVAAGNDRIFPRLCEAISIPEVANDARFMTNLLRCEHHAALKVRIEQALAGRTANEWLKHLTALGIPCGPVNDIAGVMQDHQVKARGMLMSQLLPNGRPIITAGCAVQFAGESMPPATPAPALDQHREALLKELGI
ncbi:CaiB/BaiF CoA transferase family protein [Noviherbaspirillum saxi]|uniref:CoA transferase n=1 Tax=Noviherbaspirillum saxi TaxID=2320863 RepID=A0A3A3FPL1_9BURK|nr:CoA transferase [Noviherbaspirillum saxi]RJF95629.1 CoA transferase [Noviherbaspirillum saxi]